MATGNKAMDDIVREIYSISQGADIESVRDEQSLRLAKLLTLPTSSPSKVYKAYISQNGTDAPFEDDIDGNYDLNTAKPFVDTIGGVWGYAGTGSFTYTKEGAFANVKKVNVIFHDAIAEQGADIHCTAYRVDDDILDISSFRIAQLTSPSINNKENGVLYKQGITIEVYL